MVTPALKKEVAGYLQEQHARSQRRAAALVGSAPSVLRHRSKRGTDELVRGRLRELAAQWVRFGYRRLHVLLRREGLVINRKKTHHLYKEERLHSCLQAPTRCGRWTSSTTTWRVAATSAL